METMMIEVNCLEHSPLNARRTVPKAALEEMKASLLAHGLMQNLVVTADGDGTFKVIAGGRRLAALRELQQEGTLPEGHAVVCQLATEEHALEMSLAENTVRMAMHPADAFEAFAQLIDGGQTVEQIAERFGVTTRHVEQRLKLGKAAPELLEAYRAEKITLDSLMAFTVTDDRAKQLQVFDTMEAWHGARDIRDMLTHEMAEAGSKLARFVGLDAYHAAGGVSRADLFGDQVYLENPDLLHRLFAEKLDGIRKTLEAEGWKWVEASLDRDWSVIHACGRIHPHPIDVPQELSDAKERVETELEAIAEAAEIDGDDATLFDRQEAAETELADIEEKLEAFVAYDQEDMKAAGCYVSIGRDGAISIEKGLVKREDMKRPDTGDGQRTPRPQGMPESLRRDLESYRLQAAQLEIARNRLLALDLLAFTAARSMLTRNQPTGMDVEFRAPKLTDTVLKDGTAAGDALEAIRRELPLAWLHQPTESEQFHAFIGLSDKDKLDLLAYCVATSLKPQLSTGNGTTAYEVALSLTEASMDAYWRPTRSNYLGRITRDQLLALGRELLGEPWSQARSRDKKGELADALERAFADPDKIVCTPPQRETLRRWLPEGMAFDGGWTPERAAEADDREAA